MAKFIDAIWYLGQEHKVTYDEWSVVIGRLHYGLLKSHIESEPSYQIVMNVKDGKEQNDKKR